MIQATHTPEAPWHIVPADDKRRARLNLIRRLLDSIPYKKVAVDLPKIIPKPQPRPKGATEGLGAESRSQVTTEEGWVSPYSERAHRLFSHHAPIRCASGWPPARSPCFTPMPAAAWCQRRDRLGHDSRRQCGSSSLKFQVFEVGGTGDLQCLIKGQIDGIGTSPRFRAAGGDGTSLPVPTCRRSPAIAERLRQIAPDIGWGPTAGAFDAIGNRERIAGHLGGAVGRGSDIGAQRLK
jgi:Polyphosphate kinase 2 (PPK2)